MINAVNEYLWSLFTFEHVFYFVSGMVATWTWHGLKAWHRHRTFELRWNAVIVVVCAIVVSYITVSTHQSAQCVREFNRVLTIRSQISTENDKVSREQRTLVYDWIHSLLFPPPEIAVLEPDDPRRQQWAMQVTLDTDEEFAKTNAEQQHYDDARAANPLPNPTCTD